MGKVPIIIPADVPRHAQKDFVKNYAALSRGSENFLILAGDHRMEHLQKDYCGPQITAEALSPEHIFNIAQQSDMNPLATNFGLIARYGRMYPTIPYIAKLTGKTNVSYELLSTQLWDVPDVLALQKGARINICGVGATVYLGSEYEAEMLAQAAHIIHQAHQHGLVAMIWMYLRGKSIKDEQDPELTIGACGLAATLGADIIKIKAPRQTTKKGSAQWLRIATAAAGNSKVIVAGGEPITTKDFIAHLHEYIHDGGIAGGAIGRNVFQKSLHEAVALTNAASSIIHENASAAQALKMLK